MLLGHTGTWQHLPAGAGSRRQVGGNVQLRHLIKTEERKKMLMFMEKW
jgi:hypothetical protein